MWTVTTTNTTLIELDKDFSNPSLTDVFFYDYSYDFDQWQQVQEKKRQHLRNVEMNRRKFYEPCMHDSCVDCVGTGVKHDGSICIHMISCSCPRCSPRC